jgi:hypothetical protein
MLLTDLRKYLVVTDKYSEFKDLNRAILAPAIKEINKVSDIEISFDVKRHARKISHLIFSINKKKEFQPEFDSFGMERRILINSVKMEELGISLEDQKILTNKYDVNKIEKALLITRTDMLTKDIVNTAAYFKDALKGNWLIPTNSKNSNVLESSASVIPAPSANEHIALLQDKEWQSVLQKLLKQYGDSVFNNWIKHLEFEEKSKVEVKLSAPTKFIKEWCLKHYLSDLEKFWFETDNTIKKVTITVAKKNK